MGVNSVSGITLIKTGVGFQLQALNILQLECGYIKRHKTNYNWGGVSVTGTIFIIIGVWVQLQVLYSL